jgi:fido (protein-threonine AMPylation protein)
MTDIGGGLQLKDFVLLGLSYAGGIATAAYFYRRQSHDADQSESRLDQGIERAFDRTLRNGVKGSLILHKLQQFQDEFATRSDLVGIKAEMEEIRTALSSHRQIDLRQSDDVLRYKALGDRWSEIASMNLGIKILDQSGQLTVARLLVAHKSIFPPDFPWSGEIRTHQVQIVENYGTTVRVVDTVGAESRITMVPPGQIVQNLDRLIVHWNDEITRLMGKSAAAKIDEVAHFHHEFALVHPFTDGNGRIGRMLLEEQLELLFDTRVNFRPDRGAYYRALRALNLGVPDELRGLIRSELEKFNVVL